MRKAELARLAGVSHAIVSYIIKGERIPTVETLCRLALALDDDPRQWLVEHVVPPLMEKYAPLRSAGYREVIRRVELLRDRASHRRTATRGVLRAWVETPLQEVKELAWIAAEQQKPNSLMSLHEALNLMEKVMEKIPKIQATTDRQLAGEIDRLPEMKEFWEKLRQVQKALEKKERR